MKLEPFDKSLLYVHLHFSSYLENKIPIYGNIRRGGFIVTSANDWFDNNYSLVKKGNTWYLTMETQLEDMCVILNNPDMRFKFQEAGSQLRYTYIQDIDENSPLARVWYPIRKLLNKEHYGLLLDLNWHYMIQSKNRFSYSMFGNFPLILNLKYNPNANNYIHLGMLPIHR